MTEPVDVPGWLALLAAVVVGLVLIAVATMAVAARRSRRRTDQALAAAEAAAAQLRSQVAALERRLAQPPVSEDESSYQITRIGAGEEHNAPERAPVVATPVFVDIVMRESAIKTTAFAAGVRRALAPETRNRIRFEMKREIKRSRAERKADLKRARRDWQARQRGAFDTNIGEPT